MKDQLIIGIDCGANGAISTHYNGKTTVVKMPVEFKKFLKYMKELKTITENIIVFIEKVQMRPSDMQGGKGFNIQKMMNHYTGLINGMDVLDISYIEVHPVTWTNSLKLVRKEEDGVNYRMHRLYKKSPNKYPEELKKSLAQIKQARKNRYKKVAQNKFPHIKATLWNCDALLLLYFGFTKIQLDKDYIKDNISGQMRIDL